MVAIVLLAVSMLFRSFSLPIKSSLNRPTRIATVLGLLVIPAKFSLCGQLKFSMQMAMIMHYKCRNGSYSYGRQPDSSDVLRQPVPDDKVSWDHVWHEYSPPFYIAPAATNKPWADPVTLPKNDLQLEPTPAWNSLDGTVDRRSHLGLYEVVNGIPRNPIGRTGLAGRGILGRWGPNHAADPIVTRWKRELCDDGEKQLKVIHDVETDLPILQFVAIQRRDTKEWAIPGGMVDAGEVVSKTLQREFEEEALNFLEMSDEQRMNLRTELQLFFADGTLVYKGYVDDPRNTDDAWMETIAMNFHDESGSSVGRFRLQAGDDAAQVQWTDVSHELQLYASHGHFLETVTRLLRAHW